jgi:hypothetical protein
MKRKPVSVQALRAVTTMAQRDAFDGCDVPAEMYLYRDRTLALLRRYCRLSLELGRVPGLLGREFFRSKVTSYRMHNFEDVVIFVHDVERCLDLLDQSSRGLIARVALQEHTYAEAAQILGMNERTVERRFPETLDLLSHILVQKQLLKTVDSEHRRARSSDCGLPPRKPMARIFACQEPKSVTFAVNSCAAKR